MLERGERRQERFLNIVKHVLIFFIYFFFSERKAFRGECQNIFIKLVSQLKGNKPKLKLFHIIYFPENVHTFHRKLSLFVLWNVGGRDYFTENWFSFEKCLH